MTAANVDYLLDLPCFAVSDPDEPTPIYDALTAERAPRRRDARGRFVRGDVAEQQHKVRGRR